MSDFGYWSSPLDLEGSYEQIRKGMADIEYPFMQKKKQLVWRGEVEAHVHGNELMTMTRGKQWADVKDIGKNATELNSEGEGEVVSIPEHCLYQFVLQAEGKTAMKR